MFQKNTSRQPYVGVSGIMTGEQVCDIASAIPSSAGFSRPLMVGILMSLETIRGDLNRHPARYPKFKDITDITRPIIGSILSWSAPDNRRVKLLPLIHYASHEPDSYAYQVLGIMERLSWQSNEMFPCETSGFQLNARWPDLRPFREMCFEECFDQNFRIVLQISASAMTDLTNALTGGSHQLTPHDVVIKLKDYVGTVSDVLIDPSAGKGIPMDVVRAIDIIDAIKDADLPLGVGVAGGLDAESIDRLAPLFEKHPDVSIDSEGRLRVDSTDELDLAKAKAYVAKAYGMLEK